MRVPLKGLHKVKKRLAGGKTQTYYYAWRGGPRLMVDPIIDPAGFVSEFHAISKAAVQPDKDSLAGLIVQYKTSPAYTDLSAVSQRDYDPFLAQLSSEFGDMPIIALNEHGARSVFKDWRDTMAQTPRKADRAWAVVKRVFSWALDMELITRNPCTGGGRLWKGTRADIIWTDEQIELANKALSDNLIQALMLALWTGQRQGDILNLTWSAYDGQHIRLKQSKTGKRVTIRVYSTLKTMLDSMDKQSVTILTSSQGTPWTSDGFKTSWGRAIKRAGITGVTFHDLRGTFITKARRSGATVEEIAAASGHSIKDVTRVLEAHYLAHDEQTNDAVILKMEKKGQ